MRVLILAQTVFVLRVLFVSTTLTLVVSNTATAAEQWGWTAEIRRGTTNVTHSDPTVYPNQSEAAAAMRNLNPPQSSLFAQQSAGHGNPFGGTVDIEYNAPQAPLEISNTIYSVGVSPILFGLPPQIVNPINAAVDDDLVDAINEWHKANGPAVCESQERNITIDDVLWTYSLSGPGPSVAQRAYSFTQWSEGVGSICFESGRGSTNVYRTRDEFCPSNYENAFPDANGIGHCTVISRGVVRGTPHQCEITPISTKVGNPCDTVTGAKTETEIDYSSDTVDLVRSYNSHAQIQSSFGPGWMHNYDRFLSVSTLFSGVPAVPSMLIRSSGVSSLLRGFSANGETVWQSTSGNGLLVRSNGSDYRVYLRSGGSELYDSDGRLIELVDAAGKATQIARDADGLISIVTGPFGKTLTFSYDTNDQLVSIDDPAGNSINYGYGSNGELTTVTYQDDSVKQYHYENSALPFHLTGITDENGNRFSTFVYDSIGRTVLSEHAGGVDRFEFGYFSTQTVVTDPGGADSTYQFTTDTTKLRKLTALFEQDATTTINAPSFGVDWQRRPTTVVDPSGVITEFAYDQYHVTQMTEAKGLPEERTTTYEYLSDNSNLVTRMTTPSVFAGQSREVVSDFGNDNLPDTVTISGFTPDGAPVQRIISTTYNALGQPLTIDGPRTDVVDVTTFTYYECTTGSECGQPQSHQNALGHTTTFNTYDIHGRLTRSTDPNGIQTDISYDLRGRMSGIDATAAGETTRTTTFTYEANGNLSSAAFPTGLVLNYEYNDAQRQVAVVDNAENRVEYAYDLRGNRTADVTRDPSGIVRRQIDRVYDYKSRLTQVTSAGIDTDLTYNGRNELTQVDAFQYDYDSFGNLIGQAGVDQTSGLNFADYNYSLDVNDELEAASTLIGSSTLFGVDDIGNILEEISPDRGTLMHLYDAAGNAVSTTDARGIVVTRNFDALDRPTSAAYPNSDFDTQWIYDSGANGIGYLAQSVDYAGTTSLSYAPYGEISAIVRSVTSDSLVSSETYNTTHTYTNAGQLETVVYPSGREISYSYDMQGRTVGVSSIYQGITQDVVAGVSYLPFGSVESYTYGNGLVDAWQFNSDYTPSARSIGGVHSVGYSYDDRRNITQIADNIDATLTQAFGYGRHDELVSEVGHYGTKTYQYDGNLNRLLRTFDDGTSIKNQALSYELNTNRMATRNGNAVTHDAAGNVIFDGSGSNVYAYDETNRLALVTDNGVITERYRYAGGGERLVRESIDEQGDVTNRLYEYLAPGQILTEIKIAASGSRIERDIVWLNGAPVAQFRNRYRSDGSYRDEQLVFLHTDHLGSPRIGTSLAGAVSWRWDSDAFGKGAAVSDPDGDGNKVFMKLRLPGQIADSSSGKRYNYYRNYDQGLGRYLESDPIGLIGGFNTYGYVGANPVHAIDPFGLEPTINIFPRNEQIYQNAQKIPDPQPGVLSVAGHGNPNLMVRRFSQILDAKRLADIIRRLEEFKDAEKIQLLSCQVGLGENSLAQLLADELGIPVEAPNKFIFIDSNGDITLADPLPESINPENEFDLSNAIPDPNNLGEFIEFQPR